MIQIKSEQQVLNEGFQILLSNMEPSAAAIFFAACNLGQGNYLKLKDQIFSEESVDSLYAKILDFKQNSNSTL